MPPPQTLSIRTQLLLLMLAVALPLTGLWGWYVQSESSEVRNAAFESLQLVVENVSQDVENLIGSQAILVQRAAAQYQGDKPLALPTFSISQFRSMHVGIATVGVRDLRGNDCAPELKSGLSAQDIASTPWGALALKSDELQVSDAYWDAQTGRWLTVLTYPTRNATGNRTGFLYVGLDLLYHSEQLLGSLPRKLIVPIFDRQDHFLMRSQDAQSWIGKPLPEINARRIRGITNTQFSGPDIKGVQRLYTIVTLPHLGWRIAVGVPEAEILSERAAATRISAAAGLVLLFVLTALLWSLANKIVKPILALAVGVQKMEHDANYRVTLEGPLEVQHVAQRINALRSTIERQTEEHNALRDHYATIIQDARDMIFLFDPEGRIVDANVAALLNYGYDMGEILNLSARDLQATPPSDWPQEGLIETMHRRKNGEIFPVEESINALLIDGKTYRQTFVRDITERRIAQKTMQRQNRALQALSACSRSLVNAEDIDTLLNEVCDTIVMVGGYRLAWVGFVEHDAAKSVRIASHAGAGSNYVTDLKISWGTTPWGMGPSGTAIREVKTVIAHDLKNQPNYLPWRNMAVESGFVGSIALPLKVRGAVLGVLTIYTDEAEAFDAAEVQLLEELSDDLAYGIESRRTGTLRETLEDRLIASETRLRMIIESAPAGIFAVRHGVFIYANPRMEEILGYGKGELAGKRSEDVVVPEDWHLVLEAMQELAAHGSTGNFAVRALRKDHAIIGLGLQDVRADYEGEPAIIGMAQDITERQRTQSEIQHYIALLEHTAEATLQAVAAMVEQRDPYTAGHERRVGALAAAIGAEMGLSQHAVRGLNLCGIVHDIGKIAVPAELLSKPTRLNDIEMSLVRMHAQTGYDVLKDVDFPWPVAEVIRQHHERMDGSGYPRKLQGDAIIPEARIMMVADVVESMSSHRPYRPSLGLDAALAEIEQHSGTWYDPQVVAACLRLFRDKGYAFPD